MKLKHIFSKMVLFAYILCANNSSSQITLTSNGFEGADTWTISSGTPTLNELTGSTDTPANSRIKSGSKSWLINGTTETVEFSSQTITGNTGVKAIVYLSSTSVTSGNGADNGDYVRIWANVNGTGFPTDADIELTGTSNAKWDYNANLTATTVAGTSISNTAPQGGTNANNYATLVISIPDGSTSVAIKIEAHNNSPSELWNIDDVTLVADNTSPTVGFDAATSTEIEMSSSANIPITVFNYDGNQIDIDINVTGGTAEMGDYTFTSPTSLLFTTNETKNITFDIHDDADSENETLIFTITETSSVTGLVISQATHTVTIIDDDVPSLIITEVADPSDELEGRFVEIYNNGTTAIDLSALQIHFVKQVNAGSSYATIALTGTIQPNTVYIIGNAINVNTHYGFAPDVDFSDANGNGDDAYFLYFGGDKDSGTLLDAYGVLGIDGTGETWEYANTRAYRTTPKTTLPNATWTASEWTVEADPKNVADMTPGALENEFRYDGNWKPRDVYANITASDDVLILSNATLTDAITAKNFDVSASIEATIASGKSLIVLGTSTGNIIYKRNLPAQDKWYLVSSPVVGETIENLIATHTFATGTAPNIGLAPYDNTQPNATVWDYQTLTSTGSINSGQGYSVRLAVLGDISFTGTLNTDDVTKGITIGGGSAFNLIGNPYPSFTNSGTFLATNSGNLTSETIWIWNQATDSYDTKVAMQNFMLAPTQGFFVQCTTASDVTFAQTNQSHEGTDTFQRQAIPEIKLLVADGSMSRYAQIYYLENVTTGFDNGYDGELFGGVQNNFELYTHLLSDNQNKKYQIQSLPNSEYESMVIPVGIKADTGKEITFSAETMNLPTELKVFLEDKNENIFTRLGEANTEYTVTLSEELDGVGRFYIHTSASALSIDAVSLNSISVYKSDASTLRIVGLPQGNTRIKLFNVLGNKFIDTIFGSKGVKDISLSKLAAGIYIAEVQTEIGTLNKKFILE